MYIYNKAHQDYFAFNIISFVRISPPIVKHKMLPISVFWIILPISFKKKTDIYVHITTLTPC